MFQGHMWALSWTGACLDHPLPWCPQPREPSQGAGPSYASELWVDIQSRLNWTSQPSRTILPTGKQRLECENQRSHSSLEGGSQTGWERDWVRWYATSLKLTSASNCSYGGTHSRNSSYLSSSLPESLLLCGCVCVYVCGTKDWTQTCSTTKLYPQPYSSHFSLFISCAVSAIFHLKLSNT